MFDLEETLVHVSKNTANADLILPVRKIGVDKSSQGSAIQIGIFLRPRLIEVLKELKKSYELILFTSSSKEITSRIVDYMEKDGALFDFKLTRDKCYITDNSLFIKDLRIINRPLSDMILVDDSTYSYGFQLDNGVPIIPFTGNPTDAELTLLVQYIEYAFRSKDVRKVNRDYFRLHMYEECSSIEEVYKKIFK